MHLASLVVRCGLAALLVLSPSLGVLAAPPAKSDDRATLKRLSDAWDAAIVRKDRAAIEANMTDDFRHIGGDGITGKAAFVDGLVAPDLRIVPYAVEDFEIRIYGDVALLSGRTRMTGVEGGEAFAIHYRYIDVYVKRGGRWRVASVQTTRVSS